MLHWASIARVDRPLALVVAPFASVSTAGVAHTQGWICGPENTGPPIGWLVTTRLARCLPPMSAKIAVRPTSRPVTRPMVRPSARRANAADTSRVPATTRSPCDGEPAGTTISTSASPPEIRSARLDSVLICSAGSGEAAAGGDASGCSFARRLLSPQARSIAPAAHAAETETRAGRHRIIIVHSCVEAAIESVWAQSQRRAHRRPGAIDRQSPSIAALHI